MGANRRLRPSPDVHTKLFDEELVILDLARGEYLALDPIGAILWRGLEAGQSFDEIADRVAAEYDVSCEQARADLEELANELTARGLFRAEE